MLLIVVSLKIIVILIWFFFLKLKFEYNIIHSEQLFYDEHIKEKKIVDWKIIERCYC